MLKLLRSLLSNKNILVKVDRNLAPSIIRNNPGFTQQSFSDNTHNIRINLMQLVRATGTIQTRRTKPTYFQKLTDKSDLLDFIGDSDDFCVIKHNDADKQIGISEDLGVGLSVLITDHYFRINWLTLAKNERRQGSKPDIKCLSHSNEALVVEAKGTTSKSGRSRQKTSALRQKNAVQAHVNIASCALLRENVISDVDFSDPSFIPPEDVRYERSLLKADHYARVFNLIGQKELSKYFDLMRKRIIHNQEFLDFYNKQKLFDKIKTQYIKIGIGGRFYFGNVEKFEERLFVFIGIDESLLSVDSFVDFQGYEDQQIEEGMNSFYLLSDGLCIALLKNIDFIETQIKYGQIPHHFDPFSMIDFDYCRESTIVDYLSHLFEKVGCKIQKFPPILKPSFDLMVTYEGKGIAVEVKRYLNSRRIAFLLERPSPQDKVTKYKRLVVTNSKLSTNVVNQFREKNIELIDRTGLYEIIENNEALLKYLK